jgi:hypothetical protein
LLEFGDSKMLKTKILLVLFFVFSCSSTEVQHTSEAKLTAERREVASTRQCTFTSRLRYFRDKQAAEDQNLEEIAYYIFHEMVKKGYEHVDDKHADFNIEWGFQFRDGGRSHVLNWTPRDFASNNQPYFRANFYVILNSCKIGNRMGIRSPLYEVGQSAKVRGILNEDRALGSEHFHNAIFSAARKFIRRLPSCEQLKSKEVKLIDQAPNTVWAGNYVHYIKDSCAEDEGLYHPVFSW